MWQTRPREGASLGDDRCAALAWDGTALEEKSSRVGHEGKHFYLAILEERNLQQGGNIVTCTCSNHPVLLDLP